MSEQPAIHEIESYPEQQTHGLSVEGRRYTSKEFLEKEWEGMWTKVWLLLGRESELPNPGDWQMEPVGREEVLMVRQADGGVKAFYNICQHRGNRLVSDETGHVDRFVCKYHSWAFVPDGELVFAQDAEQDGYLLDGPLQEERREHRHQRQGTDERRC